PARQHLPLSCLRPGGTRVPLGECLPRRPAPAPTFPPVASHLCLRPAGLRPLVRTRNKRVAEITESTLVDYVRSQLEQDPEPTPQTVNHRLGTVRCCYRFHTGQEIPAGKVHFQRSCTPRSPLGYGRP